MAIVRRDAVQSLVGLQSCGGSRFYCCIIAELCKQGAHQGVTFTRVQICLNGIGRRFRLLPEICILNLCITSSFSLATAAAAASNEMKRHRDVSEVNGMVGNAKSEALQSVNPGGCSQHRTADRVSHLSSINVPEHKQMLTQIESNSPPNKRHMVTSASSSIHRGQHMLDVFTALDAEYKAFELPLTTKTSVDCSSLTKRVDSWMCSIEETQHKARVMSEESADLKQRLESLLSEIVSTQTQLVDGVSPHARPNHLGTPCGEPTMCLERKVVDIKDGRCKNNNFFEITSSSNASEDESLRERHCPSLTSRHAGITSSMDVHTVTEEQMSDLSDADLMFEEDIEAVMQSILTDSSIKTAPDFATSLPFDLSYATESQHRHQLGDHDDSCLDSRGGIIPDAMRSAFELNSSSHHCDLVDSSYICDAERTALAEKEAIMSASHVHGRADCAEKRTAWNEDSGIETPDTPLFSECCTSQSRDVECLKPIRQSMQKRDAMAGYCGFFRADSASEEDCFQPREGVLNAETELDSSPATKVKGTTESTNDEAPALEHSTKPSATIHQTVKGSSTTETVDTLVRSKQKTKNTQPEEDSVQETKGSSTLPDIFEEENLLDDASLLKMVEERLLNASLKSGFRFISSRSRYTFESSSKSRRHHSCSKEPLTSIPEDTVEEIVVQFSEQCRKSSRHASRKRSLLNLFVPSSLWSSS